MVAGLRHGCSSMCTNQPHPMAFAEYVKENNMRNFAGTTVAATSCCGFNPHVSDEPIPVQDCHYVRRILIATAPSLKFNGCLKIKNLILAIVLVAIGATFPINASAKIDFVVLEKQRAENKARLKKNEELRTGKPMKKFFGKSDADTNKLRSLKLDAIPPSPRRHAKVTYNNSERALPANPARISSTAKPEHSLGAATAAQE